MPRSVRPSFVRLHVDGVANDVNTGPKSRAGNLSAQFLVRDRGDVLPLLDVRTAASKDGSRVTFVVVDLRTNATIFSETFAQ